MEKDIRGQRFQEDIPGTDLSGVIAGQHAIAKIILILFNYILSFIINFSIGYMGATSILGLLTPEYRWIYIYVIAALIAWFLTIILKPYMISLLVAFLSLFILIYISSYFTNNLHFELTSELLLETLLAFIFILSICSFSFLFNRLTNAIINIILIRDIWIKSIRILSIFVVLIAAIIGSSVVVSAAISERFRGSPIREMLLTLDANQLVTVKVFATVTGCIYSSALILSSWWVDQRQGSPWNYPNILRNWGLTIGSWLGTSFYKLNLGEVNFRGSNLANTDLRRCNLYRTCFQGVIALERARVDNRYLDLEIPKVQKILTDARSNEQDFSRINLRGAYLQFADLRHINLTNTDLSGADLQGADLRNSILVDAQAIDVDFTNANLTGICIQDWNINSKTCFTNVQCDYIYRKLDERGKPTDRYPVDGEFKPREFESLYQEVGNVVELVFKEGLNWRAFAFALQKLQVEDESLQLQVKGIEKRGELWVVKVTHNQNISTQEVEKLFCTLYDSLLRQLASKEQIIYKLLATNEELSKRPSGNNFLIIDSTITNLSGSGQIAYHEAVNQIRNIVTNHSESFQAKTIVQNLLTQLQKQNVATTAEMQAEFIKQVLLDMVQKDSHLQQLLIQEEQQITEAFPEGAIATAIQDAIAQLKRN
ncbi:pentapeptide repeat protein [Calothrix sp. NIES-2100]|uniref:pentapeptide repeat-containing protein n=1 Tax=Calothrix sp. NIES-2100 TaxID=1954172 RepID=UPI000B602FD8|nr:pentapeptide repeat protein [Calothrix sp. NIES-2100]